LKVDKEWIPNEKGFSLYIRPTIIGTQPTLGVAPASSAKFFIITSPVGPYYPGGWKPVKLLASDTYVRAWPGGTGQSKLGANYAIGILPQVEAAKQGYSQILWLFENKQRKFEIKEAGTMNIFIYWKNKKGEKELVTPRLDGTILPGVTRDSILQLTREYKEFKVSEIDVTMDELIEALNEKRIFEAFGAGTAAVVSPIKAIHFQGIDHAIPIDPSLGIGLLAKRVADHIMAIQYGEISHNWSVIVQ